MTQISNALTPEDIQAARKTIGIATSDTFLVKLRFDLAHFSAATFITTVEELTVFGHIIGPDRITGLSPFGHGSDETVAISTLLRLAGQLISASADLFSDGRSYAAAALVRQLVEVEYLAWAIEVKNGEGERWLRSDKNQREQFFKPSKLRKASRGKFRSQDYGYHCEYGGHPTPHSSLLLDGGERISQLLMGDLLGHTGRIWEHFVGWSVGNTYGSPIMKRTPEMRERYMAWKSADPLVQLPPPP